MRTWLLCAQLTLAHSRPVPSLNSLAAAGSRRFLPGRPPHQRPERSAPKYHAGGDCRGSDDGDDLPAEETGERARCQQLRATPFFLYYALKPASRLPGAREEFLIFFGSDDVYLWSTYRACIKTGLTRIRILF
jgi:hypothetical protein